MARNTGKRTRAAKKKAKVKISKRTREAFATKKKKSTVVKKTATKQRSVLLKKHAQERMVLKQHMRQLKQRRAKTVRGADAKNERREMGKYMRKLALEQAAKHKAELAAAEKAVRAEAGRVDEDVAPTEPTTEADLRGLFANLLRDS